MQLTFSNTLRGTMHLPASKSLSNRALILNALAGGAWRIENLSDADDTRVLQQALMQGEGIVDIGAAGTAMRFLTAYFALQDGTHILTGTERMKQRPIGILVEALRKLGADIEYVENEGFPPLRIHGRSLRGTSISVPAGVSSQYISALLMIAPYVEGDLHLELEGEVASRPYIEMTKSLVTMFAQEKPHTYHVEPDWSAASYAYELVALCPDPDAHLTLPGLRADSLQGDKRVADFFLPLGVRTSFTAEGAIITKVPRSSEPLHLDFSEQPDLAQTLVVACAMLRHPFRFTGLKSLRIKETDRIAALCTELKKIGVALTVSGDDAIECTRFPQSWPTFPISIATYSDHRMAMCFAPAAYILPQLKIENPEVVSKSFPTFWDEISKITHHTTEHASCSLSGICTLNCDDEIFAEEPEYYDDEELDRFRGRGARDYSAEETDEFEEVMTTMRPDEVHGWLHSLELRGLQLPIALHDAAMILVEESSSHT